MSEPNPERKEQGRKKVCQKNPKKKKKKKGCSD